MKSQPKHEIETISKALKIIFLITMIATITAMFFSIRDLTTISIHDASFSEEIGRNIKYVFYFVIQIFAFLTFSSIAENNTPFLPTTSRNIKIIGGLIMFSSPIAKWVPGIVLMINNSSNVTVTIVDSEIIFAILLGLVVACIGAIFDYGCILQKQDDETL